MAALAQPTPLEALKAEIADAIASVPAPKGVRLDRFFFDNDHAGDPAIRVIFTLTRRGGPSDKERISTLTDFRIAVRDRLWDLQTGRIPYVSFQ
jgi:hypothetical protein